MLLLLLQKQQDAFASALGFFLFGFLLSNYSSSQDTPYGFFEVTDPVLWFFKVLQCCLFVVYVFTLHVFKPLT